LFEKNRSADNVDPQLLPIQYGRLALGYRKPEEPSAFFIVEQANARPDALIKWTQN
jgi:hypothetical protein